MQRHLFILIPRKAMVVAIVYVVFFILLSFRLEASPSIQLNNEFKQNGVLMGMKFTYYGDKIISYNRSGEVKVRNLATDEVEKVFDAKTTIKTIAIDREQNWLAIGCENGDVQVWDFERQLVKHTIMAHKKSVESIAFSPNGKIIATASVTGKIWLWNTKFGKPQGYLEGHKGLVHSLAFGPRGDTLYSSGADKTIRFWSVQEKKEKRNILEEEAKWGSLNDVDVSLYMDVMAEAVSSVKRDTSSRRRSHGPPLYGFVVKLRNGHTGEELGLLEGHKEKISSVAVSPNGMLVASASDDHTFRVWDVRNRRQITSIPQSSKVKKVSFSPNGRWISIANERNEMQVYEVEQSGFVAADAGGSQQSQARAGKQGSGKTVSNQGNGPGEKYAVVIGVGTYQDSRISPLKYTDEDAKAFYDFLVSPTGGSLKRENVKLLLNQDATQRNIKSALGVFLSRNAKKQDSVYIYYAGHGAPETDQSGNSDDGVSKYLVPYDADPELLYVTGLPMSEMETVFKRIDAERIVFFLDTCYSGAAGGNGRTFRSSMLNQRSVQISGRFLDNATQGSGRVIMTASRPNELSLETDQIRHGLFTYHLLKALSGKGDANGDGMTTLRETYDYVEKNVSSQAKAMGGKQHPVMVGSFSGEIVIGSK